MGEAVVNRANAQGHTSFAHSPLEFATSLTGLFAGLHWTDVGGAKVPVIEDAMKAMLDHQDGPTAMFVPASSSVFRSATWLKLEQQATVIDEPLASGDALDAIVRFALLRNDLSPPKDLSADSAFRSYLLVRMELSSDLGDTLWDVDDYILTRLNRTVAAAEVEPRVPESSLTRAINSFLRSPSPVETRALLTQVLLRGEDEKLALGALSTSTSNLLHQHLSGMLNSPFGEMQEALIVWTCALLATHAGVATLRGGYAPSWRSHPDVRAFAVVELCRKYRMGRRGGDQLNWLAGKAAEAMETVPLLLESDEKAFEKLTSAALDVLNAFPVRPLWCADLAARLEAAASTTATPSMRFDTRLASISCQPIVVEHLRRRVIGGTLDDAVLFHGPVFGDLERVASAYAKAVMCETPNQGDACGICQSCKSLENGSSPHNAIVRLRMEASLQQKRSMVDGSADSQVHAVRQIIFQRSLWPGRRVVILDGVDQVHKGALDRILKAVEDSPPMMSLVFLAERLGRVPAALRSRSTILKLKPPRL
jgi:hypothetical protein